MNPLTTVVDVSGFTDRDTPIGKSTSLSWGSTLLGVTPNPGRSMPAPTLRNMEFPRMVVGVSAGLRRPCETGSGVANATPEIWLCAMTLHARLGEQVGSGDAVFCITDYGTGRSLGNKDTNAVWNHPHPNLADTDSVAFDPRIVNPAAP